MHFRNSSATETPLLPTPATLCTTHPRTQGPDDRGQCYVVTLACGLMLWLVQRLLGGLGEWRGAWSSLGLHRHPHLCKEEAESRPALADLGLVASGAWLSRTSTDGWHLGRAEHPGQDRCAALCVQAGSGPWVGAGMRRRRQPEPSAHSTAVPHLCEPAAAFHLRALQLLPSPICPLPPTTEETSPSAFLSGSSGLVTATAHAHSTVE